MSLTTVSPKFGKNGFHLEINSPLLDKIKPTLQKIKPAVAGALLAITVSFALVVLLKIRQGHLLAALTYSALAEGSYYAHQYLKPRESKAILPNATETPTEQALQTPLKSPTKLSRIEQTTAVGVSATLATVSLYALGILFKPN